MTPQAKVDDEILDYKDLAAIPKVKAIYDIERPDLITYESFHTSTYDERQDRLSMVEVRIQCLHYLLLCCGTRDPRRFVNTTCLYWVG